MKSLYLVCLAAITGLVWYLVNGCDDKVVAPKLSPAPASESYAVYFYDAQNTDSNWYFEYFPETDELDSFYLPCQLTPVASADGNLLYAADVSRLEVAIVDLKSREVVGYLPYYVPIAASPNNEYLAVWRDGLAILRTSDYAEIYFDATLTMGEFTQDSRSFVGTTMDYQAFVLSLSDSTVWRKSFPEGSVYWITPSHDNAKLFLYMGVGSHSEHLFAVYDVDADSLIFSDPLWPGGGYLEITPSGDRVFYTNPGNMLYGAGPPWINAFDVVSNSHLDSVSTVGIHPEPYDAGVPMTYLAATPDNRWLVALAVGYPSLMAVDLRTSTVERQRLLNNLGWYQGLSCQPGR